MHYNSQTMEMCAFFIPSWHKNLKSDYREEKKYPSELPEGSARFLGRKPHCLRLYPIVFCILVPMHIKGVIEDVATLRWKSK